MAIQVNTSSIAALASATTAINSLQGLLLASPQTTQGYQPENTPGPTGLISLFTGPPALLFHYEGEQTATLTSDITDHFLEDNKAVQDQVALRPVIITTHGFIGELNNVPSFPLSLLQQTANTLTSVGSYLPSLSITAQIAYDSAFAAYQLAQSAANAAVSAVSSIGGKNGESVITANGTPIQTAANQNKQQTYFQQFYGYWQNRTLFTIQTPWAIFQHMVIQNLRAIQDAETRMITDFELSFKQINIASTSLLGPVAQTLGRFTSQSAPLQGNGTGAIAPSISVGQGLTNMGAAP